MFELLAPSEASVFGVKVTGKLSLDDEQTMLRLLNAGISEYGKIRLLVDINEYAGASLQVLWEDIKWMASHINAVERLAIVVDSEAMAWLVRQDARIARQVGVEEKHFNVAETDAAWSWLCSESG